MNRGNQLAPWVNSSLTATELDRALKNHIDTIMKHYKGKLYAWDVVVRHDSLSRTISLGIEMRLDHRMS